MKKLFSIVAAVLFAGGMMADNFVRVTDMSELAPGDQVIIVSESEDFAMGAQNTSNRAAVAVTVNDGVIAAGEGVQVITLEAAEQNLKLKVGEDAYLYAASSSSNHLKTATAAEAGDNAVWDVLTSEDTVALIAQGENSRKYLRYNANNGNPIFSCYGETSSVKALVKFFKKAGDTPVLGAWNNIVFTAATTADELSEDSIFLSDKAGFQAQIADAGNKMSIDANTCRFGTADDYTMYNFRLKSGGASGSDKNFITIAVPEKGKLRVAPRTGSGSATDRELYIIQNGDTLYSGIIQESMAVEVQEDEETVKVYPYVEVPVVAGNVIVRYSAGMNFYAFGFNATVTPEPTIQYYVAGSVTNWQVNTLYKLVANPATEGEYMGEFTFPANSEFKVVSSLDGVNVIDWFPTGMNNNYQITEDGDYKVFFRPDGQGGEGWHEGCIYVIMKEKPVIVPITCAEVYSKAKNDEVALNEVVVTYVNGAYVYVKDASASMLIYLPSGTSVGWQPGSKLTNLAGKVDIYNGLYEVKPSQAQVAAVEAVLGEAPAPEELTAAPVAADVNKYVIFKNVKMELATFPDNKNMNVTIGEQTFVLRNQFNADIAFDVEKSYDLIGAVAIYSKNDQTTIQVYFISADAVQGIENVVLTEKAQKVVVDGVVYIVRDNKMYTIQGTQVR